MAEVLLDSDILIDHLRGYEPARQYLKRFEAGEVQGYLSIITVAELAAGQMLQAEEEAKVQRLLALFTYSDLDFAIAWRGGGDPKAISHPPGGCPDRRDRSDPSPPASDAESPALHPH